MIAVLAAVFLATTGPGATTPTPPTEAAVAMQQMDAQRFWGIMDRTAVHEADPEAQLDALREEMDTLTAAEVLAFRNTFEAQLERAYTWDLWAVAYIAHGGASDDGFEYFRRWMVSRGQAVFEQLLAHPDDLAGLLAGDMEGVLEFEEILYVTDEVWSDKTDQGIEDMPIEMASMTIGRQPRGEPFDEDPEQLERRFPNTWARFGNAPLG